MLTQKIISTLFLLYPACSFCQACKAQAVYSNRDSKPYRLERKYVFDVDTSCLYLRVTAEDQVYIHQRRDRIGDTLVLVQEYGRAIRKMKSTGYFTEYDHYEVTRRKWSRKQKVLCYKDGSLMAELTVSRKLLDSFPVWEKRSYIDKILVGNIFLLPDSLIKQETVRSYFFQGQLFRAEWLGAKDRIYNVEYYQRSGNLYTAQKIHCDEDSTWLYRLDTISWNKDTTEIGHVVYRSDWKQHFFTRYVLGEHALKFYVKDTLYKEIGYLGKPSFRLLLQDFSVFDDPLYGIDLLHFDRCWETTIVYGARTVRNNYVFDLSGRPMQQLQYKNNNLFRKISFAYY